MYSHRIQESHLIASNHSNEIPFFKEAVTLIDECKKIMKDDRILLRNKVKEYSKEIREQKIKMENNQLNQIKQLIQIFIEADKRKSLSKITKDQKTMHWLQVKLRKFVDHTKKQKHLKDIENYQKSRYINLKKPYNDRQIYDKLHNSRPKDQQNHQEKSSLLSQLESRKLSSLSNHSLSKSAKLKPKKIQNGQNSYFNSSYSYHQNFSHLSKSKEAIKKTSQSKPPITQRGNGVIKATPRNINSANVKDHTFSHSKSKSPANPLQKLNHSRQDKKDIGRFKYDKNDQLKQTKIPVETNKVKNQFSKLTKLLSQQLNYDQPKYSNPSVLVNEGSFDQSWQHCVAEDSQQSKINTQKPYISDYLYQERDNGQQILMNPIPFQPYRYDNQQAPYQSSQISPKQIMPSYPADQFKKKEGDEKKLNAQEQIFTPPQFLAECRKLLQRSEEKHKEPFKYFYDDYSQMNFKQLSPQPLFPDKSISPEVTNSKVTFSNMLFGRESAKNKIKEVSSQNLSEISPNQTNLFVQDISIHSVESLLMYLFARTTEVGLTLIEINTISNKCEENTKRIFQQYNNYLSQTNQSSVAYMTVFRFLDMAKYLSVYNKILCSQNDHISVSLSKILDINNVGFIQIQDVDSFIQTLNNADIGQETSLQIRSLLIKVFDKAKLIEQTIKKQTDSISKWSLYYLQMTQDKDILDLKDILNKFQFQIDSER